MLENESEAIAYLTDLLKQPKYQRMEEIISRAQDLIVDENLKNFFINNGNEMLITLKNEGAHIAE